MNNNEKKKSSFGEICSAIFTLMVIFGLLYMGNLFWTAMNYANNY